MKDKFGNVIDEGGGFAFGSILRSPVEIAYKARWAAVLTRRWVEAKGLEGLFVAIGCAYHTPLLEEDLKYAAREYIGPAFYMDILEREVLDLLGGDPKKHGVACFNRSTGGIIVAIKIMAKEGTKVISFAPPPRSHSSIRNGVKFARAEIVEVLSLDEYKAALEKWGKEVSLVVLTGANPQVVTIPSEDLVEATRLAKQRGLPVFLDDAVATPYRQVLWGGPKALHMGVDAAIKSIYKGSVYGPRGGVMAGNKDLMNRIYSFSEEWGFESRPIVAVSSLRALQNYDPKECERSKAYGDEIYEEAVNRFGKERVQTMGIGGMNFVEEDCLEMLMERAGEKGRPMLVPMEASVSVAMAALEYYGISTVAALEPYGSSFSFRLKPTYSEYGKMRPKELVDAVDACFDRVSKICMDKTAMAKLLLGSYCDEAMKD